MFAVIPTIIYENKYCEGQDKYIFISTDSTDFQTCVAAVKARCPIREMLQYRYSDGACYCLSGCNDPTSLNGYNIYSISGKHI